MLGSSDPRKSIFGTSNQNATIEGILRESAFPQVGITAMADTRAADLAFVSVLNRSHTGS